MNSTRTLPSPNCFDLIKRYEGICDGDPTTVNLDPYMDPVSIWTIGWGHALRGRGAYLKGEADRALAYSRFPGGITLAQAESLLEADVAVFGIYLNGVFQSLNQNQFDALVSFTFNEGLGNFEASTLFKLLKVGDFAAAADQFGRWIYSDHKVLPGLIIRRAAERDLFLREI